MEIIDKTKPQHRGLNNNKPEYIVIHHSISKPNATFEDYYQWHVVERGWEWVGYQYVLKGDGTILNTRPDTTHGAHVKEDGMNKKSIGICLSGNFDINLPTEAQKKSLKWLLEKKMKEFNIPKEKILPHRHWATYKSCNGNRLSDDWGQRLVDNSVDKTCEKELNIIKLLWSIIQALLDKVKK